MFSFPHHRAPERVYPWLTGLLRNDKQSNPLNPPCQGEAVLRWNSASAFESSPEIETGSPRKKKKIESVFDDQLIHKHLDAGDDERH